MSTHVDGRKCCWLLILSCFRVRSFPLDSFDSIRFDRIPLLHSSTPPFSLPCWTTFLSPAFVASGPQAWSRGDAPGRLGVPVYRVKVRGIWVLFSRVRGRARGRSDGWRVQWSLNTWTTKRDLYLFLCHNTSAVYTKWCALSAHYSSWYNSRAKRKVLCIIVYMRSHTRRV